MSNNLAAIILLLLSVNVTANEVRFYGPNAVIPDAHQQTMIAESIDALVHDCTVATKIGEDEVKSVIRGLEVHFTKPITVTAPPAGEIKNINKVVVRLWDNAEQSYGMDIYAYNNTDVYLLGKYTYLAYPIINMIIRPMPPSNVTVGD